MTLSEPPVRIGAAGALAGAWGDRDLASVDVARVLTMEGADALRRVLDTPVVGIMSSDVISVEPEAALADAVELMLEHTVGALPVVRPDTREVVGIVSYIDVLRAVRDLVADD
jgi:CBS domain-containing protein